MTQMKFYFDEMMPHAAEKGLIGRGYEVIMAVEVGMMDKKDLTEHLPYTAEHNLVLVTHDQKFAGLAASQFDHAGVICWTGDTNDFGGIIKALTKFAEEKTAEDVKGRVFWLK